ncbi:type II 3-dehydroquinate dehydratase [Elusimicrobiota bacterium]
MRKRRNILVLHGPNLNLLGEREPEVYGRGSLADLNRSLRAAASIMGLTLRVFQRNGEGELLDVLHQNRSWADGVLINPGAYTHYSYALRDGLAAVGLPAVEVHLSDISRREKWRRVSVIASICLAQVMGQGAGSYIEGLKLLDRQLGVKR